MRTNSKNTRQKKIFEHIIKLKVHDLFEFAEMDNFMREIKNHKGDEDIENAFSNRYNNLFYLCTNDLETAAKLKQEWPKNVTKEWKSFHKKLQDTSWQSMEKMLI